MQASVMSKRGCKLYAVCSQKQKEVNRNIKNWRLTNFETIVGDHVNSFAKHLKSDDNLFPELEITDCNKKTPHPFLTKKRYPFGATQPAVIFFVGKVPALRWSNKPQASNFGGAFRRPDPEECWKEALKVEQAIKEGKQVKASDGTELPTTVGCEEVAKKTAASLCTIM